MKRYLLFLLLALTSCARSTWHAPLVLPPDSGASPPTPLLWGGGKIKATTVIFQAGTGNVATPTDNTKAGQKGGAAATAPQAQASATTKPGGLPWWVFALVAVLSTAAWEWSTARFIPAAWLPWRQKPGLFSES
ncbi:hypothetical protein Q5H92_25985 [Hymenobacter sp. M29]|uniref:Uncharacterized protein n=1 Tax=Hymenobacter mellowenesis TaxID=3063995 RepID=A0ABT9AIZ6_9BACT|nr:hypothetical protein [Hymenobacter sp. M29]MDO7849837.1 hypothetical protein [Hymenobacter sp. M29]